MLMSSRTALQIGAVVMVLMAAGSTPALAQLTCPFSTTGVLDPTDPDQTGRLFRDDPGNDCALNQPCAIFDAVVRDFDMYTFTTPAGPNPACVTVNISNNCGGAQSLQSAAYTGSFDPNNLCTNALGDIGATPNSGFAKAYSFNVPPSTTFVVTVNEAGLLDCPSYQIDVTGCDVVPVELLDFGIETR
jgi:hypothetical protein